jgi:hypothetical protein
MLEQYKRNDQDIFVPIGLQQTWDRDKTIRNFSEEVRQALPAFKDEEVSLYENKNQTPSVGFYFPDGTNAFDGNKGEPNAPNNFSRKEVMSYNSPFRESYFILEVISSPYSAQRRVLDRSYIYLDGYYPEFTQFLSSYLNGSQHTDYFRYMSLPRWWEKQQLDQVYVRAMFFNAKNGILFESAPKDNVDLHLEENLVMPVSVNRQDYTFDREELLFAFLPFSVNYSRQAETTPRPAVVRPDSYLFDVGDEGLSVGDADTEVTVEGNQQGTGIEYQAVTPQSKLDVVKAIRTSYNATTDELFVEAEFTDFPKNSFNLVFEIQVFEEDDPSSAQFELASGSGRDWNAISFNSSFKKASRTWKIKYDSRQETTTNPDGTTTTTTVAENKANFYINTRYNPFVTYRPTVTLPILIDITP